MGVVGLEHHSNAPATAAPKASIAQAKADATVVASASATNVTDTSVTPATHKANGNAARRTIVYEYAKHEDIPQCAQIATEVFVKVASVMFRAGPTQEQVAYRTMMFDKYFDGMLAYHQGKRTRPQGVLVGRDEQTSRVIAFMAWTVEAGADSEQERTFALTDDVAPTRDVCHPDVPEPPLFDASVRQSFVKSSTEAQERIMGQRTRCYIKYLAVDPNVQRTGSGRALLRLARLENRGLPLFLEAATTESSESFYLKMSFDIRGQMTFKNAVQPLPCMVLEPSTPSLLDDANDNDPFVRMNIKLQNSNKH